MFDLVERGRDTMGREREREGEKVEDHRKRKGGNLREKT